MYWQSLLYVFPLFVAAIGSLILASVAWNRRPGPGIVPFVWLMLAAGIWSAAYGFELVSEDLAPKIFWAKVQYLGIATLPVAWFLFALQYTGRESWVARTRRSALLLGIVPTITVFLVWTNDLHGLIWQNIQLEIRGSASVMAFTEGPWYWLNIAFAYVLLLLGTLLLIQRLLRGPRLYKAQGIALVIVALLPWMGNALYVSGLSSVLDPTPFAFVIAGLVIIWSLFRFRLLDIVPVARDFIIEGMSDGVLVLDAQDRIVDANPAAAQIVGRSASEIVGQPAAQALSDWSELVNQYADVLEAHTEIALPTAQHQTLGFRDQDKRQHIYEMHISPLRSRGGQLIGRSVLLRDVNDRAVAEERLKRERRAFHIIAETAVHATDVADLCNRILEGIVETFGFDFGTIRLYDKRTNLLQVTAVIGLSADETQNKVAPQSLDDAKHTAALVARTQKPIFAPDISTHPILNTHSPRLKELDARSMIAWPILGTGKATLGVIQMVARSPKEIPEEDRFFFETLAEMFATVLERKQAEEALRDSQARYRSLVDNVPIGIYRNTPGPKGKFLMANPAFLEMFGFETEDELKQVTVAELHVNQDQRQMVSDLLFAQGSVTGLELRLKKGDGTPLWGSVTARVVYDQDAGQAAFFDCTIEDITERVRAEQTLQQRTAQLEALRKVGLELTAELDLNTLLHSIATQAVELLECDSGGLFLYRPESNALEWAMPVGPHADSVGRIFRPGEGLAGKEWASGEPLIVNEHQNWGGQLANDKDSPWMAVVAVPVHWRDEFLGILTVVSVAPRTFSTTDADLLSLFATQAAAAIQTARLFQVSQRRASELAALIEIDRDITATLDLPRVLERIAFHAKGIVEADGSDIYLQTPLFDPGAETLQAVVSLSAYTDEIMAMPAKLGHGIVGSVAQQGKAEIINHAERDPRSIHIPGTPLEPEALLCAPLVARGEIIGVMVLSRSGTRLFTEVDLNFLVSLAQQASIAIQNAWLYEEAQQRTQELRALHQTTLDVAAQLEMPRLLTTIGQRAIELLGVDGGAIYLLDSDDLTITLESVHNMSEDWVGTRLSLGEGGAGLVAQTGEPLIVEDYGTWPGRASVFDLEVAGSVLQVPINWGQRRIGVLGCHTAAGKRRTFNADDIRLLQSFAQQVAVAVENARLFRTEQQRAAQLAEALARQQELDQLQAEFIQNVSHELRTPLALIRGYAEMLNTGALGELAQDQQKPVSIITRRARLMGELVDDITAILELEAKTADPVPEDLTHITQQALADFQTWAEQKNITLQGQIEADVPLAMGESRQLRKVIDNLISNSLKFTPENGVIRVGLSRDADWIKWQVQDTGIGIPPDQLDRVFERFYQVDGSVRRRYGGTGLGLALVKEIVEHHNGRVAVESQLQQGSTFSVWLPTHG